MAELPDRDKREADFAYQLGKLSAKHRKELTQLLRERPADDATRDKFAAWEHRLEEFWQRVQYETNAAALGMLMLTWRDSAILHGMDEGQAGEFGTAYAYKQGATLAHQVTKTSRKMVADFHAKAKEAGEAPTVKAINGVANKVFGPKRVAGIAQTETVRAQNRGAKSGMLGSGRRLIAYWRHSELRPKDHSNAIVDPCPICSPLEGQPWRNWGGLEPGDAHVNCDCFMEALDPDEGIFLTSSPWPAGLSDWAQKHGIGAAPMGPGRGPANPATGLLASAPEEWDYRAYLLREGLLEYSEDQPRDELGRFAAGAGEPGPLDKRLVDYKPDRKLTGPGAKPISDVLPAARLQLYSKMPFIDEMHARMGVDKPLELPVDQYLDRRGAMFRAQPVEDVPADKLVVTQHTVNEPRVREIMERPETAGKEQPFLVRHNGETYVINGHHRIVADVLSGKATVRGNVLDLDKGKAATGERYSGVGDATVPLHPEARAFIQRQVDSFYRNGGTIEHHELTRYPYQNMKPFEQEIDKRFGKNGPDRKIPTELTSALHPQPPIEAGEPYDHVLIAKDKDGKLVAAGNFGPKPDGSDKTPFKAIGIGYIGSTGEAHGAGTAIAQRIAQIAATHGVGVHSEFDDEKGTGAAKWHAKIGRQIAVGPRDFLDRYGGHDSVWNPRQVAEVAGIKPSLAESLSSPIDDGADEIWHRSGVARRTPGQIVKDLDETDMNDDQKTEYYESLRDTCTRTLLLEADPLASLGVTTQLREYSEDQERDEHGRWTAEGIYDVMKTAKGPMTAQAIHKAGKEQYGGHWGHVSQILKQDIAEKGHRSEFVKHPEHHSYVVRDSEAHQAMQSAPAEAPKSEPAPKPAGKLTSAQVISGAKHGDILQLTDKDGLEIGVYRCSDNHAGRQFENVFNGKTFDEPGLQAFLKVEEFGAKAQNLGQNPPGIPTPEETWAQKYGVHTSKPAVVATAIVPATVTPGSPVDTLQSKSGTVGMARAIDAVGESETRNNDYHKWFPKWAHEEPFYEGDDYKDGETLKTIKAYGEGYMKASMATRIGRALEPKLTPEEATAAYTALRAGMADPVKKYYPEQTPHETLAMAIADNWAGTSGDHNAGSNAVQLVAQEHFKLNKGGDVIWRPHEGTELNLSKDQGEREGRTDGGTAGEARDIAAAHSKAIKAYLDAVYHETQKTLKDAGIEKVTLFRGFKMRADQFEPLMGKAGKEKMVQFGTVHGDQMTGFVADNVKLRQQPLSSYATNIDTAYGFSGMGGGASMNPALISVQVPRSKIWSTPATGPGVWGENEIIVLSTPGLKGRVIASKAIIGDLPYVKNVKEFWKAVK